MRFERTAELGHKKVRATYSQRGQEYGDTVQLNNWLILKGVMRELGFPEPSDQECRFIFGSAMLDVKYWRNLGGYKEDSIVDGNAYSSHFLGEIELNGGLSPQSVRDSREAALKIARGISQSDEPIGRFEGLLVNECLPLKKKA